MAKKKNKAKFSKNDFITGIDRSFVRSIYQVVKFDRKKKLYKLICVCYNGDFWLGEYQFPQLLAETEYKKLEGITLESLKILYGKV